MLDYWRMTQGPSRPYTRIVRLEVSRREWRANQGTVEAQALDRCQQGSILRYEQVGYVVDPASFYGPYPDVAIDFLFSPKVKNDA